MPAYTRRQQRFMGAELGRRRRGMAPRVPSMTTSQVEEFARGPIRSAPREAARRIAASRVSRRRSMGAAARSHAASRSARGR